MIKLTDSNIASQQTIGKFFRINIIYNQNIEPMNKNLFSLQQRPTTGIPTTPRKKSQFKEHQQNSTPRIKYRYTIVEKPTSTWLGNFFVVFWLALLVGVFAVSYQSKLAQLQIAVKQEIQKCRHDFTANKCETPLKGIKNYCDQKLKCLQTDPQQLLKTKMQGTFFLGTIIREFFQGLGLPLILVSLAYLIFGNRKCQEVKKQFVQYC